MGTEIWNGIMEIIMGTEIIIEGQGREWTL
jgi:hypothetical protein